MTASVEPRSPLLFARNLFLPADLGGNRYPYEVVRRLGERGHPVTVATPRLHDAFPPLPGVRYHFYPVNRRHPALTHVTNVLGGTLGMRSLRGQQFPVALAGSYDAALALGWNGVVPRTPLIFLFHSEFYSEWVQALRRSSPRALARRAIRAYMAAVERRVFGLSARLVAVSEFSAGQIRSRAPETADRVRVIPTGVDTGYFVPPADSAAAKRAVGADPDRPLVLGVGRLVAVKQFDRLVEAFARARTAGLNAQLVIAGDGPERAALQRLLDGLDLSGDARLAGYCDPPRLRAFMQAADLQVCSSAFENFSLAILEGMASGTAVLGTPGGGTPELVGAVDPTLVLPADDVRSLADGLRRFVGSPDALSALGARARALVTERYDWERVVDRLEALCREVNPTWA